MGVAKIEHDLFYHGKCLKEFILEDKVGIFGRK